MMVSWIPSGRIGFCWPQWMFEVWSVTLTFMSLGHHHCPSPSMAAPPLPLSCPRLFLGALHTDPSPPHWLPHSPLLALHVKASAPHPLYFLYEHSLCLCRQASEECVVIAQALNGQMLSLWFHSWQVGIVYKKYCIVTHGKGKGLMITVSRQTRSIFDFSYATVCSPMLWSSWSHPLHPLPLLCQSGTSRSSN